MSNSIPHDLLYIPERKVMIPHIYSNPIKIIHISSKIHLLFQQYAWEYAKVKLPYPKGESQFLRQRDSQKIAKAMLTHQTIPIWHHGNPFKLGGLMEIQDARKKIIQTKNVQPDHQIDIMATWHLRQLFLEGETLEIIGFQGSLGGYAYPGTRPPSDRFNFQYQTFHIHTEAGIEEIRQRAYRSFLSGAYRSFLSGDNHE